MDLAGPSRLVSRLVRALNRALKTGTNLAKPCDPCKMWEVVPSCFAVISAISQCQTPFFGTKRSQVRILLAEGFPDHDRAWLCAAPCVHHHDWCPTFYETPNDNILETLMACLHRHSYERVARSPSLLVCGHKWRYQGGKYGSNNRLGRLAWLAGSTCTRRRSDTGSRPLRLTRNIGCHAETRCSLRATPAVALTP